LNNLNLSVFPHTRDLIIGWSLVCLFFIFQPGFSQSGIPFQDPEKQKTDTIEQVIVTGQFRPQPADHSIYKIEVIDAKQIRLKAATNLGDLLKTEPGFNFHSADLLGDFVRIRGLTGEHIKILIDGMPVTGRVFDRIDFGQLTLHNVDHIEIIEGPMSVVYGSNAMAGVINIITHDYSGKKIYSSFNSYYETIGKYNVNLTFATKINRHTIGINASRNFFGGWGPVDTSRYKSWPPKLQYTSGITYKYRKENLRIGVNSDYLNEELRDPGALTLANLYEKALDGYHFTTRWNNRINLTNTFHDNFVLNLQAGYSYYKKRRITYLNDLVNSRKTVSLDGTLHDTTLFHLISARGFASNITGRKFEYQTGFDFSYESAYGKRTNGHRDVTDLSGFMNIIFRPLKTLGLQPGVRIMYNSNFKAPIVYGFSVKFNPDPFTIKASYARGFRAPSLRELYLQFVDNNHRIYGNENLKAETADNLSLSANYNITGDRNIWNFELDFFYNAMDNAIQLALSRKQPGTGKYFNVGGVLFKTKGAELGITYKRSPGLTVNAAVISTGKVRLDDTDRFSWSTDFVFSTAWHFQKTGTQLAVFYKYTDEYLEFAGNYDVGGALEAIGQELTSDFQNLDLTISQNILKNRLNLSTGIKNIFNVTRINSIGDINIHGSMDGSTTMGYGRTWFITAGYTFFK